MNYYMKKIVKLICFSSFLILLSSCFLPVFHRNYIDRSYFGDEVDGRVIDLVTQKPISNVVVSIQWNVKFIGLWSGSNFPLYIDETVTDQNGYFKFPVWGPKQAKEDTAESNSPTLFFLKEGFYPIGVTYAHSTEMYRGKDSVPFSFSVRLIPKLRNKVITMNSFDGNIEKYVEEISRLGRFNLSLSNCNILLSIPRTIWKEFKIKKQLKEELKKRGITEKFLINLGNKKFKKKYENEKEFKKELQEEFMKQGIEKVPLKNLRIIYDNIDKIIGSSEFEGWISKNNWQEECPNQKEALRIILQEETSP
jgi:hypothetical protein